MTLLQQRITTAPPTQINANDFTAIFTKGFDAINAVMGPLIHIAYFVLLIVILWQIASNKGFKGWTKIELVALAIAFGLMR